MNQGTILPTTIYRFLSVKNILIMPWATAGNQSVIHHKNDDEKAVATYQ